LGETFFGELKRYVRFDAEAGDALRRLRPHAAPRFVRITEEFYARLDEHEEARRVISGEEQRGRLRLALMQWMDRLLSGPWDEDYYQARTRIGRIHVRVGLPQRYMFGAMNVLRARLLEVAEQALAGDPPALHRTRQALDRILDLELAIMLEAYSEAFLEKAQQAERLEKRLLEARLAMTEARYREIVETAEAPIATMDAVGTVELLNRRCEEMCATPREQAMGQNWLDLFIMEDQRAEVMERFEAALAGRWAGPFEAVCLRRPDRRVRWHFTSLPDAVGPALCAMGLDVTEEHDLAIRTRRAERLAALGTLAAGLAHEIRNPLNAAALQLDVLRRRLGRRSGADVEGALETSEVVRGEIGRLASLVDEFLQFARPRALRLAWHDLRATLAEVVSLLEPYLREVGVRLDMEPGPQVEAEFDEERIKQVVHNLVRNAAEAAGPSGRVRVAVSLRDAGAVVEVEDNGPGLPQQDQSQIFEPFYTTKPGGTGLGLAIVHRIVNDHGGTVGFESVPGRTRFAVTLPPTSRPNPAASAAGLERE
jgi:PAS domain S-box-containing protein